MMLRWLYSLIFYSCIPLVLLRLFWRSIQEPEYRCNLAERFGFVAVNHQQPIWVHAVSAGETIAAVPLIKQLRAMGFQLLVTNMTPTGKNRVQSLLPGLVANHYVPYDLPDAMQRFLNRIAPRALILIDTELWPNMIHQTQYRGIPIYLVNARLGEQSYANYRRFAAVSKPMFKGITHVFAQSEPQGQRFLALGTNSNQLEVAGSIKFDIATPTDLDVKKQTLANKFKGRRIFLGASTHQGEEHLLLNALASQEKEDLLILAPRHLHRVATLYKLCLKAGYNTSQHSLDEPCNPETDVYLLDVMGELIYFYAIASLTFVGGSLVNVGGHNPMEPASLGIPMLMGPYQHNICDIAEQFISAGAMLPVNADNLASKWVALMQNPHQRQTMSAAASQVMALNRGALKQILRRITKDLR